MGDSQFAAAVGRQPATGEEAASLEQEMRKLIKKHGADACEATLRKVINEQETRQNGTKAEICKSNASSSSSSAIINRFVLQLARKRRDVMIRGHEKIRSAILDASFDAMFAVNMKGIIQLVNHSAVVKFGYEHAKELVGQNISIIIGGGHAERHDRYMKNCPATKVVKHLVGTQREVLARRKDGSEFPVMLGLEVAQPEVGDPVFVSFVRDMTQEKRAIKLEVEKRASEELLKNVLPEDIAKRLKKDPSHLADHHASATILFADIVGFTAMSSTMCPIALVKLLNDLFSRFDALVDKYKLNKVKTIGDCYMVTSIPSKTEEEGSALRVCNFAFDMLDALQSYNKDNPERPLNLRVGINAGPVVAGVVGTKRFLYDVWGSTVNEASRMESTGVPGKIQVPKDFVDRLPKGEFGFEERGTISVKGIGDVETVFLTKRIKKKTELTRYWFM